MVGKTTEEHEQLRGFILEIMSLLPHSEETLHPVRATRSLSGLRQASRDMVEMCQDLADDQVAALDARLASKGLPTLTHMRDRRYRSMLAILSRGRIKSDEEFRLLNSFVSDVDSPHLSEANRTRAETLLGEYEFNR